MNDPLFDASDDAATPLSPEEQAQIIPTYITTRAQLNEAEQLNITEADLWAFTRKRNVQSEAFLKNLHQRMFRRVWKWAGTFRASERNIGIEPYRIPSELREPRADRCCDVHVAFAGCQPSADLRALLVIEASKRLAGGPICSGRTLPTSTMIPTA